jgi:hypothetical protein
MRIATFVLGSVLMAGAPPAFAQEAQPLLGPQFEQRYEELAKWLREYHAWEQWLELWGNRVAHNFNDQEIWERKKRPEPPVWLEEACRDYIDTEGLLASGCYILRNWDEQPLLILQRRRVSLVTSGGRPDDQVVKSSFFQRVHLTGLWTQAQFPATPLYGIVGMQVSVVEVGRYTLPAMGVMLVMVPDGAGGHDWKPATTLGLGYRICDFVPPLFRKQASLHINIARMSIHGVRDERIAPGAMNATFVGLSVSRKRRH